MRSGCKSSMNSKFGDGKFGDATICAEFSEHFKSVCKPNTPERDAEFKAIFDNCMIDMTNKTSAVPHNFYC